MFFLVTIGPDRRQARQQGHGAQGGTKRDSVCRGHASGDECPRKKSHPREALQPRFPKEPNHRRAADDSLTVSSEVSAPMFAPARVV